MSTVPDLSSLRLLTDVVRLGSIGAAGRIANMSQQSASERLRALERQTGLTLLHRSTTGSSLTAAGRLLVEWSHPLLEQADQLGAALHTMRTGRSRELRVYASMTTAEWLLPRWLVRLRQERATSVSLHATNTSGVLEAVRDERADVGFIERPDDLSGLSSRVVGHDTLVLVAHPGHPWARRRSPLSPDEIGRGPLTSREHGSGTRQVVVDAFRAQDIHLAAPEVELTTTASVLAAVREGSPPAFVSDRAVSADAAGGHLVEVATSDLDLRREFRAIWSGPAVPPSAPVRDLLAIARRAAL